MSNGEAGFERVDKFLKMLHGDVVSTLDPKRRIRPMKKGSMNGDDSFNLQCLLGTFADKSSRIDDPREWGEEITLDKRKK